ncbi:hypothetical protein AJ80_06929 [Polytolypa hystricis UAMH7299]|uniref:Cullin family profile domain-containing protein n=1 Tax=Polytolypa hystricis (strain UAMH7299) TaxID=1447883 RepID=A0A2B7XJF1_POLH7|nr:hypothetical protein AJ80_06929 [Polytolypa hystricis UAMH7299]
MDDSDDLNGLRGLYQDLSALSRNALPNLERLVFELESTVEDFRKLLDKPPKKNESRQAVLSGKIKLNDAEYSLNEEFRQETLQVADALDLDEIEAAGCYMRSQSYSTQLDRSGIMSTIIHFHERRAFLLECLRLILHESFEVEREGTQALMQDTVAAILEIQNGALRNASIFARKCMDSMVDIEKWLVLLAEQVQKASIVGQAQEFDILEIIEYQRNSLARQHESLGAILCYLFKGTFPSSEDLRQLLGKLKNVEKFDVLLTHYIPPIISAFSQYGSPEGSGSLRDARSLHQAITASKGTDAWASPRFHAATIALWLAEYSGWYYEPVTGSPLQGVNPEKEAAELSKLFMTVLDDGALEFFLAICAGASQQESHDPARNELVNLLLKESMALTVEPERPSMHFYRLLVEHVQLFIESLIANMPDAIRTLKSDEDIQRLDQITALREGLTSNLHRGLIETRMHLETLLVIIAFAFEHRIDAAQEFWTDPDGNLYGFLQWASKRQTVPRVSAFCEMLCSISEGEENSLSAHKFLLIDEDKLSSAKLRRTSSMNWAQMFSELQLYSTRVTERPSTTQPSILRIRKPEPADIDEPESPVMLTCYLRLISHLCRENRQIRQWVLQHPTFNLVNILFTLCNAPVPSHLRACIFVNLRSLMVDRTTPHGNEMWIALDQWTSGAEAQPFSLSKAPVVPNSPVWNERHIFHKITEAFDQTNAFVELLTTLVSPAMDTTDLQLYLPFPESLGSSYRMPGIEPYIDFVMGQVLGSRSVDLQNTEAYMLQFNCLNFAATCLESFNENLVSIINQPSIPAESSLRSSALSAYIRLHPFARVMEWLFNEDVLKAMFSASRQDINAVAKASEDAMLLRSLLRSIDIMNIILERQPTYFDVVRPLVKSTSNQSTINVANSSLSSFEDSVMDNLGLITDLCLYCGTGHPQLTMASLALLEKLSSSRKLNKGSSAAWSHWQSTNQIVEVLNSDVEADRIGRSLALQMAPGIRELESGPEASGYLIKTGLLGLLDRCLRILPDTPNMAHLLLGFSCIGKSLDISAGGLLDNRMSLLHAVIDFIKVFPDGTDGSLISWMIDAKRLAFQALQRLWASKLSTALVLPELRSSGLLVSLLVSQPLVSQETLWDNFPIAEPEFWLSDSSSSLASFLFYRSLLFDYAATEIRSSARQCSPSVQNEILSTVFGSSPVENGQTISHASFFDLFDFADLDIYGDFPSPSLKFFTDVDIELCAKVQDDGDLVLYDLVAVRELFELTKGDLLRSGIATPQDEEQLLVDEEKLLMFLRATNQSRRIGYARYLALRSWTELATTILVACNLDDGRKAMFILQVLQVILPKLENSIGENGAEALELARLAESLIDKLDADHAERTPGKGGDIIDERLFHLFQICIRGIPLIVDNATLRESLYNICSQYLARITRDGPARERFGNHSHQTVKVSGPSLVELVCDDAYSGPESCRIAALLFLNLLGVLDRQQSSSLLVELISRTNHLSIFVDVVRAMPSEFRSAQAHETSQLLVYYEAHLSLLQQLSQTRTGATQILDAGLFQAIKESHLFAADPDIGIDIDNPDALRKYYDLLLSVIQVIVSTLFVRGMHNQQVLEQSRQFLSENRPSMVGIFKRYAKIGGLAGSESNEVLDDLVRSYVALITAVGFLEMQNSKPDARGANRKSSGKRKLLPEHQHGSEDDQAQRQTTITDLFSIGNSANNNNTAALNNNNKDLCSSASPPTSKRIKRDDEPPSSPSENPAATEPIAVDKMYNFSNGADSKSAKQADLGRSLTENARPARPARPLNSPQPSNFTPHTGAKRLMVKNLRAIPRLDQERYFEKIWSQLDSALTAIFSNQKPAHSLEELYKGAENVCRQGRATTLAKKLEERCKSYVSDQVLPYLLAKSQAGGDIDILRAVEEAWSHWNARLVTIRSIFYYLDQSFLLHSTDHPVIYEMGLLQFRSSIFSNATLKRNLLQGVCKLIEVDRKENNTLVDPTLLRRAIKLFHDLGVYTSDLEPSIVAESVTYLKEWADGEAKNYLATYVQKCHNLIDREMTRCDIFALDRSTRQSISKSLDEHLVSNHKDTLLAENDILDLFRTTNQTALAQLYSLLQRKGLGVKVRPAFCTYIVEEGTAIIFDEGKEADMVWRLLEFKQNLDAIWKEAFQNQENIGHGLRESFEVFINKTKRSESSWGTDNSKPGEMIAKHVDMLLKGGVKAIQGRDAQAKSGSDALADEDAEINRQLDQVLDLFRFVQGKAVFEAFYKNDLARRLLMGRSASDDAEKSMLDKLKTECGSSFTHNLESMFKDMDLARDEMTSYNALLRERRDKPSLDLNVNVLSASAWPSYPEVQVKIPTEIAKAISDFDQYYMNKHNGRKLSWRHSLAHCQLKARFPKGNKELVVSSFQAIVLLLFNDVVGGETLSYPSIKSATGLSDPELKRTLQSLACAKYRVLTKRPKGREINDDDVFSYNAGFSDPKMRIKINQIQLKETKQENKATHERVAADRHYETQAAIVRIMKSRKTISHNELIVEVINATKSRGVLEQADIKKNIEKLIDKDYIEREDGNRYSYLA